MSKLVPSAKGRASRDRVAGIASAQLVQESDSDELAQFWSPALVTKAQIDAEIERLASIPRPSHGRRRSSIVHPESSGGIPCFAPSIGVSLDVLLPGESTTPIRHNSATISIGIGGSGRVELDGDVLEFTRDDTWSIPSMLAYRYVNDSDQIQARLTFSDAPLLDLLHVHFVDEDPGTDYAPLPGADLPRSPRAQLAIELPSGRGASVTAYESQIDPEEVPQHAMMWKFDEVDDIAQNKLKGEPSVDGRSGSPLALLWNPATGRTLGTTNTLTAFIASNHNESAPPLSEIDPDRLKMFRSHRHASTALTYMMEGKAKTVVEGHTIYWETGDLVLTAPAWAIHANAGSPNSKALIVHDYALLTATNTNLWQEDLNHRPVLLGAEAGFGRVPETLFMG